MAVVSESERKLYYQQFQWSISSSDGQVETHKMLEFVNKRTGKDVIYKPTVLTMCKMFFGFIIVAVLGVLAYIRLKFLWNHWVFWLAGSLVTLDSFRLSTSLAAPASSTTSSMMCHSLVGIKKQEKPSFFQEETENSTVWKDGLYPFRSPWLVCSSSRSCLAEKG